MYQNPVSDWSTSLHPLPYPLPSEALLQTCLAEAYAIHYTVYKLSSNTCMISVPNSTNFHLINSLNQFKASFHCYWLIS